MYIRMCVSRGVYVCVHVLYVLAGRQACIRYALSVHHQHAFLHACVHVSFVNSCTIAHMCALRCSNCIAFPTLPYPSKILCNIPMLANSPLWQISKGCELDWPGKSFHRSCKSIRNSISSTTLYAGTFAN